ncbi:hypothetical protein BS47DRAFT_1390345 [Hydnum rufescens UP504]|uniref:Uncharacterized protein n=1 Tax=Hydnum rufescens UP504 TaxID=1448309 RepID=A0A9P6B3E5_9AGAM|nr:hypothetical protein BS47DRAFT_1390345 [Hydnum rufescens UP504]
MLITQISSLDSVQCKRSVRAENFANTKASRVSYASTNRRFNLPNIIPWRYLIYQYLNIGSVSSSGPEGSHPPVIQATSTHVEPSCKLRYVAALDEARGHAANGIQIIEIRITKQGKSWTEPSTPNIWRSPKAMKQRVYLFALAYVTDFAKRLDI